MARTNVITSARLAAGKLHRERVDAATGQSGKPPGPIKLIDQQHRKALATRPSGPFASLDRQMTALEKRGLRTVPGAANLENAHRMILEITHVPTGLSVTFPAFLELFSDAYTSEWNAEQVYGRMDPIATFSHTRRALALAWNVPAESMYHSLRAQHTNPKEASSGLPTIIPKRLGSIASLTYSTSTL
jgi:hypothetical protein